MEIGAVVKMSNGVDVKVEELNDDGSFAGRVVNNSNSDNGYWLGFRSNSWDSQAVREVIMPSKEKYTPDELTAFFNFDAAQALELEPPPAMDNGELIGILEEIQSVAKSLDTTKDFVNRSITRQSISRRECVGILKSGNYPDYAWYDKDYEQIDKNGDVWTPEDAYHKHPCVAVLGRGKGAEAQLFDWLKWFDENNFKIETGSQPVKHQIELLMGKGRFVRMVKQKEAR
jgi:hypothetical protein